MTTGPFHSAEEIVQVVQGIQTAYYGRMSALIIFIWDYGELINDTFDRVTYLVFGSPSSV